MIIKTIDGENDHKFFQLNKEPTTVPHFLFANIFFYYTLTTRKFINGRFINGFREKQRGRRQSENQKFKIYRFLKKIGLIYLRISQVILILGLLLVLYGMFVFEPQHQ